MFDAVALCGAPDILLQGGFKMSQALRKYVAIVFSHILVPSTDTLVTFFFFCF